MTARRLLATSVTDWPERLLLVALLVVALLAVLGMMRAGWVRRGRRQGDIAPLPEVPQTPTAEALLAAAPARYLGTTRAGDWLDRVVVHGLGTPSAAEVTVGTGGVWCRRTGAPDLFVPAAQLSGARHDRGMAGRVYEAGGVLVVTWRHAGVDLDTGLRVRDAEAAERLRTAVAQIAGDPGAVTTGSSAQRGRS